MIFAEARASDDGITQEAAPGQLEITLCCTGDPIKLGGRGVLFQTL